MILLIVFAAIFNFEVAEHRDRLLVDGGKAPSAWPEYLALLAIGGAVAVISFWKMFSFMDPYLRPRRCHENREGAIEDYEDIALKSIRDGQQTVTDILQDIAIRVDKTQSIIQSEQADFEFRCSEAIREANEKIGYYHLKYCPVKVDPDPATPEMGEKHFDFSSAQGLVSNTIGHLDENCQRAKDQWQPLLEQTRQSLVSTHQKYQAVVVANIQAALAKAR